MKNIVNLKQFDSDLSEGVTVPTKNKFSEKKRGRWTSHPKAMPIKGKGAENKVALAKTLVSLTINLPVFTTSACL